MPVAPPVDQEPQAAYVTASSRPSQYPPMRELIWTSYERLRDALPLGEEMRQTPDGVWERKAVLHDGSSRVVNGVLEYPDIADWRRVALSLAEARAETGKGRDTDFWCGWTWVRHGQKPEIDQYAQQAAQAPDEIVWRPAPPADQAAAAGIIAQQTALASSRLVAAPDAVGSRRGRPTNAEREARAAAEQEQE